jgi:hypothetical protein
MKNTGSGIPKTKLDYEDSMLLLEIEGMARDGYDDQQIAEWFDVAPETFSRNKRKKQADGSDSKLKQALTRGRRPLSVLVENSLYKRAIGQTVITKTFAKKWLVVDGKAKMYTDDIETHTELPGDVNAMGLWLKNHKPEIYNQQPQRVDMTTNGNDILNEVPRITIIEHVMISDNDIKKTDEDFSLN